MSKIHELFLQFFRVRIRFYKSHKLQHVSGMTSGKEQVNLTESEWQIVLDALSNTIFNEELTEESRKNAKELFLKLQKKLPQT